MNMTQDLLGRCSLLNPHLSKTELSKNTNTKIILMENSYPKNYQSSLKCGLPSFSSWRPDSTKAISNASHGWLGVLAATIISIKAKQRLPLNVAKGFAATLIFVLGMLTADTAQAQGSCANFGTLPFQDFDCDGIINSADFDDDNDGILDKDESCLIFQESFDRTSTGNFTARSQPGASTVYIQTSGVNTAEFKFEGNGMYFNGDQNLLLYSSPQISIPLNSPTQSYYLQFSTRGFLSILTSGFRLVIENQSGVISNQLFYCPAVLTTSAIYFSVPANSNWIKYSMTSMTSLEGAASPLGNYRDDLFIGGYSIGILPTVECASYNLDSDGDGCPDAIEGGGSFTLADIDGDGALTGAVDANGVPTAATANGQTIGDSQNDAVQSADCASMVAAADNFTNIPAGGTTPSVFTNDNANGTTPATDALVTTPTVAADGGLTGVTFNADGTANIPAGATAGTYNITYNICLESSPSTCGHAVMTVAVAALCAVNNIVPVIIKN
jgi:hypothetical protein